MEHLGHIRVALLTEGVDRNHFAPDARPPKRVALLTEGVDRNVELVELPDYTADVALLTEGVDRNSGIMTALDMVWGRPPHGGRG